MGEREGLAGKLLLSAPPGELQHVSQALHRLAGSDLDLSTFYEKYNKDNCETVQVDEHKIIVSHFNCLEDGKFVDRSGNVVQVDHCKQRGTVVDKIETCQDATKEALEKAFDGYVKEHYNEGLCAVTFSQDSCYNVVIVATKFSPSNYWNGKFKSVWTLDSAGKKLTGKISVRVHYFEDGNVQLDCGRDIESSWDAAADAVKTVKRMETEFQNALDQAIAELSDTTFKSLRRQLPITKTKIDWNKIFAYRLGSDLASK